MSTDRRATPGEEPRRRDVRDRWEAVAAAVQAASTFGMFVVALIGIWNVQPIINYQIERQAREQRQAAQASSPTGDVRAGSPVAASFVGEIAAWWRDRVQGYERILQLIRLRDTEGVQVSFAVAEYPGLLPGTTEPTGGLLVTARHRTGETEQVRVPVNDAAISPAQYVQFRLNHGAFASLDRRQRSAVETAVMAHTQRFMMPVPPPRVASGMSIEAVYAEIDSAQRHRREAMADVEALALVIDAALVAESRDPAGDRPPGA